MAADRSLVQGQQRVSSDSDALDTALEPWMAQAQGELQTMGCSSDNRTKTYEDISPDSLADGNVHPISEPGVLPGGGHWFLSTRDRQYIRALVVLGFRQEATMLVHRAYARRCRELESSMVTMDEGLCGSLFTPLDLEYVEMLVMVGDRRSAIDLILRAMDDYELGKLGRIVHSLDTQSRLKREYEQTVRAIEKGEPVTCLDSSPDPAGNLNIVRRLLRSLRGRGASLS